MMTIAAAEEMNLPAHATMMMTVEVHAHKAEAGTEIMTDTQKHQNVDGKAVVEVDL